MKVHLLIALMPLFSEISNGQNLLQNSDLWGTSGSAAPNWSGFVLGVSTNSTTAGTNVAGNWTLSGTGRVQDGLSIGVPILDVGTRAQTSILQGSLLFSMDTRAQVGALNLGNLLGVGVAMSWAATYSQSNFAWGDSQTLYTYSATVACTNSLLNDIAALGTNITFTVRDGAGVVVRDFSGDTFLNALGITVLSNGSLIGLSTNSKYQLSTEFMGGDYTDGLNLSYSASSLLNTSLLGVGNSTLEVSDISFSGSVIPEPTVPMLSAVFIGMLAVVRRRKVC